MPDSYKPPFGAYTSVQVAAAAAQAEIVVNIQILAALIGVTISAAGVVTGYVEPPAHPDFGRMSGGMRAQIGAELAALAVAVEAMPTA